MVVIPRAIVEEMLAHLREAYGDEGCGLLGGKDGRVIKHYPTANVEPENKRIRYLIDPKQQLAAEEDMDANDWELTAIYHSHTFTPAYPSPTDVRTAYYPDSYYIIVSFMDYARPDIRAYKITKPDPWGDSGDIEEYPVEIIN
jgi:[CysO sulfur-carrier protein]-S-L-cysteine hydrolase